MKTPPLKRHAALQPLSRDHYVGLVQAQTLLRSAEGGAEDRRSAVAGFVSAWAEEIEPHFHDEERLLPPLMTVDERERLEKEHAALRALAVRAKAWAAEGDPGAAGVRQLGQMLDDHIRWEERELFMSIQQRTADQTLDALRDALQQIEKTRPRSACGREE